MAHIKIQNLSLNLKNFELKNINLEINKGEYFVILGETGAGKTILLECIAGLRDYHGKIFINDTDISNIPIEKRKIGLVYQDYALFPNLNVYHNIAFGLKIRKFDKASIDKKVIEISKFLGIENLLERKIENLSGGEKQRVALARTLVVEPEILLLDEPLSALDPNTQDKIKNFLKKIHKEKNLTIIHVTHNFEEAISLADRIGIMYNGEILQIGKPEEIFRKPANEVVAKFCMVENIFEGVCENGKIKINDEIEIFALTEKKGNVKFSINANEITISNEEYKTSARNKFYGKIIDVKDNGKIIILSVNVKNVIFKVAITRNSYEEMNLNVNKNVWIYFKASAVNVF
ncbi:MAG: ATP-binding cassette domain-containing protein [Candidatus Altarchaeaceae archaeon]